MFGWIAALKLKFFGIKTGSYEMVELPNGEVRIVETEAYDPAQDEYKIMSGEIESYFE